MCACGEEFSLFSAATMRDSDTTLLLLQRPVFFFFFAADVKTSRKDRKDAVL